MGSWAPTSFGNDEALDLLISLESAESGSVVVADLLQKFDAYMDFDCKRLGKSNHMVVTAESIEASLLHFLDEDRDYMRSRLSVAIGNVIPDDGCLEANEAIAAAELVYAIGADDYSFIHEDGSFIKLLGAHVTSGDALVGKLAIEAVLNNKSLLKASGATWKRNVQSVLARVSSLVA